LGFGIVRNIAKDQVGDIVDYDLLGTRNSPKQPFKVSIFTHQDL